MTRFRSALLVVFLAALGCYGQGATPSSQTGPAATARRVIAHGAFPAKVIKTLDSGRLKEGDMVEVETAGAFKMPDGTLVAAGSKLFGHVRVAKSRSKGDAQSALAITFDKIEMADGGQLSVNGMVQAVSAPADGVDPGVANGPTVMANGAIGYIPTADMKSGSDLNARGKPIPILDDPNATGVQGMNDLQLEDGLLSTSQGKQVRLGRNVQLMIRVKIFA